MTNGNIGTVARALEGITGVAKVAAPQDGPDRYVVVARMSRELDTVDSLRRRNIQAYWPSYEKLVVSRVRLKGCLTREIRRVGMIPGYVFSPLDPKLDFEQLLGNIVGAIDIVRTFSGNPWLIPDRYIRDIRRIEVGLNTPRADGGAVLHTFKLGQKVRFIDNLVGDWPPGRIVKLASDGRISVEIDLMGRKVPVTVLPHQIVRT